MGQPETQLQHALKLRHLFTLAFGSIIGVGWMIVAGTWISDAGPGGAALGFIGGGLIIVLVGMCYAEIGSMYPVSGGEVAYTYSIYGFKSSFVVAWFLALAYTASVPFEFAAVGWVTTILAPEMKGAKLYSLYGYDVYTGALVVGVFIACVIGIANYRGVKAAARLQDFLTYSLIVVSLVFVGFALVNGDPENLRPLFSTSGNRTVFAGFLVVLVTTPMWYAGFDIISQAMGEKSDSASMHHLGGVIALAILASAVFYCLIILAAGIAIPRSVLEAMDFPVAGALEVAFRSPLGGKLVMCAGLLGLVTTWNAFFLGSSRLIFAMGRAHMLPPWLGYVHPKYGTPSNAVVFVFGISFFTGFLGREVIALVIDINSLVFALTFLIICVGVLLLRFRAPDMVRPYRAPSLLVPILASLLMAWLVWMLLAADIRTMIAGGFPLHWLVIAVWSILGLLFWRLARPIRNEMSKEKIRRLILEQD